jgi:hypothetical protein
LNGACEVNQRVGPFDSTATYPNNDNTYTLDQIKLLAFANNLADITQELTDVPAGFSAAWKATVQAGGRFGPFFPLTNAQCAPLLGGTKKASLSFWAKSNNLTTIRAGLMAWDLTKDAPASDPISAFNGAGVNPTLVANWTFENTPSNITISSTWTQFVIQNIAIDTANAVNLGLFIWIDSTTAAPGDTLLITGVKINEGTTATPFDHRSFENELIECQRFYRHSHPYGTEPGQGKGIPGCLQYAQEAGAGALGSGIMVSFPIPMFKIPTVTMVNPVSANSRFRNITDTTDVAGTGNGEAQNIGNSGFLVFDTKNARDTNVDICGIHYRAEAII